MFIFINYNNTLSCEKEAFMEEREFNLYKESIVPPFAVRHKKLIKVIKVLLLVVVGAAIAGGTCGFVLSMLDKKEIKEEAPTKSQIIFAPDVRPQDNITGDIITGEDKEPDVIEPGKTEYEEYLAAISNMAQKSYRSIVMVSSITSTDDIFNPIAESEKTTSGIMIYSDGKYIYILTQYSAIRWATNIKVSFIDGTSCLGEFVGKDDNTDFGVIKINIASMTEDTYEASHIAPLGNSYYVKNGDPVIAVGNITGNDYAMNHGIVMNSDKNYYVWDGKYTIFNTNIYGKEDSFGALINMDGEVCGIISNKYDGASNMINAYAVSTVKGLLQAICNGNEMVSLGIMGNEVDDYISSRYGLPKGIFINTFKNNSPALASGIRNGDIIVAMNGTETVTFEVMTRIMYTCKPEDTINITVKRKSGNSYKTLEIPVVLGVQ